MIASLMSFFSPLHSILFFLLDLSRFEVVIGEVLLNFWLLSFSSGDNLDTGSALFSF